MASLKVLDISRNYIDPLFLKELKDELNNTKIIYFPLKKYLMEKPPNHIIKSLNDEQNSK